jgi:hypothetical protein
MSHKNSPLVLNTKAEKIPVLLSKSLLPKKKTKIMINNPKKAEGRQAATSFIAPSPFAAPVISQNKRGGCHSIRRCSGAG